MPGRLRWWAIVFAVALVAPGCLGAKPSATGIEGDEGVTGGFSDSQVFPGSYDTSGIFSKVLSPGNLRPLPEELKALPSKRGGVNIAIGLVRPDTEERVPVIAMASPYYSKLEAGNLRQAHISRAGVTSLGGFNPTFLFDNFVPRGYAVALIAARGTASSGGCWEIVGPNERADIDQAITWLAEQPWSTGEVGMVGLSYAAALQWGVASLGNPALKTIVPIAGPVDAYGATTRNGSFWQGRVLIDAEFNAMLSLGGTQERPADRTLEAAVCPEQRLAALKATAYVAATGARNDPDAFFAVRDLRQPVLDNYDGSVLIVQGFADIAIRPHHLLEYAPLFDGTGTEVKMLLSRLGHLAPDWAEEPGTGARAGVPNPHLRWDWAEVLAHWFDYWLKHEVGVDLGPRVQVEDTAGKWRNEDTWPPADVDWQSYYLSADRKLVREPAAATGSELLVPDPVRAAYPLDQPAQAPTQTREVCPGCVTFTLGASKEDLRFAGWAQVHLAVTPTGPGGHIVARLVAIEPTGPRTLAVGQMDLQYAAGGETPRAVTPNQRIVALLDLQPTDAVVPAGSELRLVLSQGGTGGLWNYGVAYFGASKPTYPVLVHTGAKSGVVRLPEILRDPAAAFDDPS